MRISYWSSDVCSSDLVPLGTGWCWARCPRGATRCGTSGQAQGTSRCPQASERIDCSGLNDRKSSNDGKEAVHLPDLYPTSEERRVGKGCVSTGRFRWLPCYLKKTTVNN